MMGKKNLFCFTTLNTNLFYNIRNLSFINIKDNYNTIIFVYATFIFLDIVLC